MTTYIELPVPGGGGSEYWQDAVANFAALPTGSVVGEVRQTLDTNILYSWDGASWSALPDQTTVSAPLTKTGNDIAIPVATALADGYLDSADWSTFNGKQNFITAGTTSQYYRGDKSFQTLNMIALTPNDGSVTPTSGQIGYYTEASTGAASVAASGSWSACASISLSAGRWQIWGVANLQEGTAVLTTSLSCAVSTSSSGSGLGSYDHFETPALISGSAGTNITAPVKVMNISSPSTVYLLTRFYYSSGTPTHAGLIQAMRIG